MLFVTSVKKKMATIECAEDKIFITNLGINYLFEVTSLFT